MADVSPPAMGVVALVVDDAADAEPADDFVPTAIALATPTPGVARTGLLAFATRRTTDVTWTESAGRPFGPDVTFADRGAYLAIFRDDDAPSLAPFQGAPAAGVALTGEEPAQVYTFADADPLERAALRCTPGGVPTGANGSALLVGAPGLGGLGATGPAGCTWPPATGMTAAPPGAVVVAEHRGSCGP